MKLEDQVPNLKRTKPKLCELCGTSAETRPYGPRGEEVCFDCGMKNEDAAKRQFRRLVWGETIQ